MVDHWRSLEDCGLLEWIKEDDAVITHHFSKEMGDFFTEKVGDVFR